VIGRVRFYVDLTSRRLIDLEEIYLGDLSTSKFGEKL
jgi:hypothetical protein